MPLLVHADAVYVGEVLASPSGRRCPQPRNFFNALGAGRFDSSALVRFELGSLTSGPLGGCGWPIEVCVSTLRRSCIGALDISIRVRVPEDSS